jgi:hypothetical protein
VLGNPWILLLSQLAAIVAVALALRRPAPDAPKGADGTIELRYPAAARRVTLVAPFLALAGTIVALGGPHSSNMLGIGVATVAALLLVRVEVAGVRVRLLPDGIEQSSAFVHPTALRWAEVTAVEWSPLARSFILRGPAGRLMVSAYLEGLAEFARAVQANVSLDSAAAGPGVRARLEELAGRARRG